MLTSQSKCAETQAMKIISENKIFCLVWTLQFICIRCCTIDHNELMNLRQDDTKLIECLKEKFLVPPPSADMPYNFSTSEPSLEGQMGQPLIIDKDIFKGRLKDGFYIEAGAYDGEIFSNSIYFELKYGWKNGLLIEPNPEIFESLKMKNRKAWLSNNCLATKQHPELVDFDPDGVLGGIINDGIKPGGPESLPEGRPKQNLLGLPGAWIDMSDDFEERKVMPIVCYPLYSMLLALGNPTVHYFSLDVEGSELQILRTIPFDKVDIKVIDVEIAHLGKIFPGSFEELNDFLTNQGYEFLYKIEWDAVFVKKGFRDEINDL